MKFDRYYVMQAKPGGAAELKAVLLALKAAVEVQPGCLRVEMYEDLEQADNIHFVERWDSKDSHDKGAKALPEAVVAPISGALGGAPTRYTLSPI